MKTIYLSNGSVVIVDDQDYEFLNQWSWKPAGAGYAARNARWGTIYMHRVLVGVPADGKDIDHKNGNKLDNRKANLRVVTHSENQRGFRTLDSRNQSGYRGVNWFKRTSKWVVRIMVDGKNLNLGYFDDVNDAIAARLAAEEKYWRS